MTSKGIDGTYMYVPWTIDNLLGKRNLIMKVKITANI